MSDSSRTQLYFLKEVTYGTTPATAMTALRFTGESLESSISTETSNEIRSDRQVTDLIKVSEGSGGGIDLEMSYGNADTLFEGALMSTWGAALTLTGTTLSAASSDNSFSDSGAGMPAFLAGSWIKVSGFTDPANNGFFQVVSRTTSKLVVAGATLVTEIAGDSVTIKGQALRNGTTKVSMTLEKSFADLTKFVSYTGCMVNSLDINLSAQKILTASVSVKGQDGSALVGATVGTGAPSAAPTGSVMNATSNVTWVRENVAALPAGVIIRDAKISLNNNLRDQFGIGSSTNTGQGLGQCDVKGSLSMYFSEETLYAKFMAQTESALAFNVTDGTNNYIFSLPRVKYSSGKIVAGGKNQDVVVDLAFTAYRNSTYDNTIEISKF